MEFTTTALSSQTSINSYAVISILGSVLLISILVVIVVIFQLRKSKKPFNLDHNSSTRDFLRSYDSTKTLKPNITEPRDSEYADDTWKPKNGT